MGFFSSKVTIRKSDRLFSEYVRNRDGDCQLRGKCLGHKEYAELQCCHFHSRRKESVRFDPENCVALCAACHSYVDTTEAGMKAFRDFMLRRLGETGLSMLDMRAETLKKRDDFLDVEYCKLLLKELPGAVHAARAAAVQHQPAVEGGRPGGPADRRAPRHEDDARLHGAGPGAPACAARAIGGVGRNRAEQAGGEEEAPAVRFHA